MTGLLALISSLPALATLGVFEHGNGIKSMGMGGVGYSFAGETTALAANPAHAITLKNRYDVGVDVFTPEAEASFEGNAAGPDESNLSDGRHWYAIPQGGYSHTLSDRWAWGLTVLSAGLGPSYDGSPYARFGGSNRAELNLASSSLVTALAYRATPDQSLGISLNTGYQVLSLEGMEFLASPAVSVAPNRVTDQGKDGAFTLGYTLGWQGRINPWLSAGLAYRSKNWTERHKDYKGLISEGGRLELPAIYGGGITLKPAANWSVVLDVQRYHYRGEKALRNGIGKLAEGKKLGEKDGPGFGFSDQNAYKLGIAWQATPALVLRGGYVRASQIVKPSETLFGFLGCVTATTQYGIGATYAMQKWEFTGLVYDVPKQTVRGKDSIPEAFGGGEANVADKVSAFGFSIGRRF